MSSILGGINRDDVAVTPDAFSKVVCRADGAISSGMVVTLDAGNSTAGTLLVIAGAAGEDQAALGVYNGVGGSGAADSTYGGNTAAAGDQVEIVIAGAVYARVEGTAAIADVDPLQLGGSGTLINGTDTDEERSKFVMLDGAYSTGSVAKKRVMIMP